MDKKGGGQPGESKREKGRKKEGGNYLGKGGVLFLSR